MTIQEQYQMIAVGIGALLIFAVVINFLRHNTQSKQSLSVVLTLIGFAFVGSPLWAKIVIKTDDFELSLLRDENKQLIAQQESQITNYTSLLSAYQKNLPPAKAEKLTANILHLKEVIQVARENKDKKLKLRSYTKVSELISKSTLNATALTP